METDSEEELVGQIQRMNDGFGEGEEDCETK